MTGLVDLTVRSMDGDDILAVVVRDGRAIVIADSPDRLTLRPRRGGAFGHSRSDRGAARERRRARNSPGRFATTIRSQSG